MATTHKRLTTAVTALLVTTALVGCAITQRGIELRPGDVPGERAFVPSIAQELEANANGEFSTPGEARLRLDEFDVSSDDMSREWPIDTITYRRFQNTAERAIYIRRALGRYAITEAREMGLGASLQSVRRVSQIASPSTARTRSALSGIFRPSAAPRSKRHAVASCRSSSPKLV